ncbi:MAG: hydrogenase formation protein HypD [Clostridiales bacterium]
MFNYIDEFRNTDAISVLRDSIMKYEDDEIKIMEVCGTHTMAISKYGIRNILPKSVKLISGPGCPVCVTPTSYIKSVFKLLENENIIIATFGDMMRIPNNGVSLLHKKAEGKDIRIIYSPLDAINIAKENKNKKIVLLSIGFETTNPIIAMTLERAKENNLKNFFALISNKTIPKVLETLLNDKELGIGSFIYPGHVSVITGTKFYKDILNKYNVSGVVTGFEAVDILYSIYLILKNKKLKKNFFENNYSRVVKEEGNKIAIEKTYGVFKPCDSTWRGIGNIPMSGLKLNDEYMDFDAVNKFDLNINVNSEVKGCICGEILKGKKLPNECMKFGNECTPQSPIGSCMVSSEGTCAAYFKYEGIK